jgi:hypothetical protein
VGATDKRGVMSEDPVDGARLELAGMLAPIVRGMDDKCRTRKVKVYRQDTGEVVGETDIGNVVHQAAQRVSLEFDTFEAEETRAKEARWMFACEVCKRESRRVALRGGKPKRCNDCRLKWICGTCGGAKSRGGKQCVTCSGQAPLPKTYCLDCKNAMGRNSRAIGTIRCIGCHLDWIKEDRKSACIDCGARAHPRLSSEKGKTRCRKCYRAANPITKCFCVDCKTELQKSAARSKTKRCWTCHLKRRTVHAREKMLRG